MLYQVSLEKIASIPTEQMAAWLFLDYPDIVAYYRRLLIAFTGKPELESSLRNDLERYNTSIIEKQSELSKLEPYIIGQIRKNFQDFYGECETKARVMFLKDKEQQERTEEIKTLQSVGFEFI